MADFLRNSNIFRPSDDVTSGLVGWFAGLDSLTTDYSGNNNHGTLHNSPTMQPGPFGGTAIGCSGGSGILLPTAFNVGPTSGGNANVAWTAWVKPTNLSSYQAIFGGSALGNGLELRVNQTTGTLTLLVQNVGVVGTTTGSIAAGAWSHVGVFYDGAHLYFYINGKLDSVNNSASGNFSFVNQTIGYAGNAENFTGSIADVRCYNRFLSPGEFYKIYASAFQKNVARALEDFVPYSHNNYVLSAAAGSLSITGNAAGLQQNLVASAGALSIAGQTASLLTSHVLSAATGSLLITGINAGLQQNLVASAGALSITGNAVTLQLTRKIVAAAGALSITGKNVVLQASSVLSGDSGALTITGNNATLLNNRVLKAATGTLSITGVNAGLQQNLVASQGALTITGHNAVLEQTIYAFEAAPGALTITGNNANLYLPRRRLDAFGGALALTPSSAQLTRTRFMPCAPGALSLTGFAASALRAYALYADTGALVIDGSVSNGVKMVPVFMAVSFGQLTIVGNDAELVWDRVLSAAAGALTIAGQADMLRGRIMAVAPGVLTFAGQTADAVHGHILHAAPGVLHVSPVQPPTWVLHKILAASPGSLTLGGFPADRAYAINVELAAGGLQVVGHAISMWRGKAPRILNAFAGALRFAAPSVASPDAPGLALFRWEPAASASAAPGAQGRALLSEIAPQGLAGSDLHDNQAKFTWEL